MSDPLAPNYKKNVGRLVVDRYAFEEHINGDGFRHAASGIDLSPAVTIDGSPRTDLQDAIETIASMAAATTPPATTTTRGVIQLAGDLSGTATSVTVSSLRGFPLSTATPTIGQVLTWNGANWRPTAPVNTFSAGGDLSGNSASQTITRITGNPSSELPILAENMIFDSTLTRVDIYQGDTNAGNGGNFTISAQSSTLNSSNGGNITISGGLPGTGGIAGGVTLESDSTALVEGKTISTGNKVVALVSNSGITSTQMPVNTGNLVVYIGNALTSPTSGNPVSGSILYSQSGKLRTKFSNGDDFELGTNNNPHTWGPTGEQVYNYRVVESSVGTSQEDAFIYSVPLQGSIKVDVSVVGKDELTYESYQADMNHGFSMEGPAINASYVGSSSVSYSNERATSLALSRWTKPDIIRAGTSFKVRTGAADTAGQIVKWIFAIKITIITM